MMNHYNLFYVRHLQIIITIWFQSKGLTLLWLSKTMVTLTNFVVFFLPNQKTHGIDHRNQSLVHPMPYLRSYWLSRFSEAVGFVLGYYRFQDPTKALDHIPFLLTNVGKSHVFFESAPLFLMIRTEKTNNDHESLR